MGGGVYSAEQILDLLHHGAGRVVVGSRAIEEPSWLATWPAVSPAVGRRGRCPGRNVLAPWMDHRLDVDIAEALARSERLPLAGILVTAVHREGLLHGPDTGLMELVGRAATSTFTRQAGSPRWRTVHALADGESRCRHWDGALHRRARPACRRGISTMTGLRSTKPQPLRVEAPVHDSVRSIEAERPTFVALISRGGGQARVQTGDRFLDHMMETVARYGPRSGPSCSR